MEAAQGPYVPRPPAGPIAPRLLPPPCRRPVHVESGVDPVELVSEVLVGVPVTLPLPAEPGSPVAFHAQPSGRQHGDRSSGLPVNVNDCLRPALCPLGGYMVL